MGKKLHPNARIPKFFGAYMHVSPYQAELIQYMLESLLLTWINFNPCMDK